MKTVRDIRIRMFYVMSMIFFGAIFVASSAQAAEPIVWSAYTYNTVATIAPTKGFRDICQRIERESNGRIKINFHLGGSLQIKADNINQAVGSGVIQLADDAFFAGSVPIAGLVRLPMLTTSAAQTQQVQEIISPSVTTRYKTLGVQYLSSYQYPALTVWSRKPLQKLQDFNNAKLRAPSPEYADFLKRLKANTVTLSVAEVPAGLERGVIDGVITSSTLGGMAWRDLLKFNYRLEISRPTSNIILSEKAFTALPSDLQALVQKVVSEETKRITADLAREEIQLTQKLKEGGMTITIPSADELAEAEKIMAPYWDEWARQRGTEATTLLSKSRAAIGR